MGTYLGKVRKCASHLPKDGGGDDDPKMHAHAIADEDPMRVNHSQEEGQRPQGTCPDVNAPPLLWSRGGKTKVLCKGPHQHCLGDKDARLAKGGRERICSDKKGLWMHVYMSLCLPQ